jgi:hypothetical protein
LAKGFQKGKSGNPDGRPKDIPNKLTQTARELFVATLENQVDNIEQAFTDVLHGTKDENDKVLTKPDPAKYLELYAKYAQYFVPKKLDIDVGGKIITVIPPTPPEKPVNKYDFVAVKKHIEALPDAKAKIKYLIEIKTDYKQNTHDWDAWEYNKGNTFDAKCDLEIKKINNLLSLEQPPTPPEKK